MEENAAIKSMVHGIIVINSEPLFDGDMIGKCATDVPQGFCGWLIPG